MKPLVNFMIFFVPKNYKAKLTVYKEKLRKPLLYEKVARKMLMKLTPLLNPWSGIFYLSLHFII